MLDTPASARYRLLFETEHLHRDLRRRSVRGAFVTMLGQSGRFFVQLAGLAVLARLLLPVDFGVFGKTIALTGFVTVIQTGGLSLATIQRPHITHEQISTLFWLNAAFGVLAGGIIAALSPAMALFYNDPRVLWLGLALAGVVAITGLTVQHDALMQRQMRFAELAVINMLTLSAGLAAAILSAWQGAGFWALVVQQYVTALMSLLLLLLFCRWLPGLPQRGAGVRPMVKLGAHQTGFNLLNFASRNFDNVLIGRFVSDAALGFYTQAYRLLLLPMVQINGPISAVVVPVLSRLQNQPERYARFYYQAIGVITFIGMPIVCYLLVDARPIVLLVLGSNWLPVVPIFHALGIAAMVATFNVAWGWAFMTLGRTDRQLKWQLLVSTPATLGAFFLGLPWGAVGVAATFSGSTLLLTVPSLSYCFRGTPIQLRTMLLVLARPAAAAVSAGAVMWGAQSMAAQWSDRWIALDLLIYGVAYFAAWLTMPGGRAQLVRLVKFADELRPASG